ncbi:PAS domain S-box protein [Gemmatimonas sp.]|uniref:PAS domain S-box protein n=1 Tax=Gemmatimonas sp. TaxID=1962908 RepID=UPI00398391B2
MDTPDLPHALAALRDSNARYRVLADTMLHGVVHQSADGRIIAMNPAAERILGKSRAEMLGSTSEQAEHHTVREDGSVFPAMEHPVMVALTSGVTVRNVVMGVYNPRERQRRWIPSTRCRSCTAASRCQWKPMRCSRTSPRNAPRPKR